MSRPASIPATRSRPGAVSRALARDRLGIIAVLLFVSASVAPLTVAAGLIPAAYATTGLIGLPAAFIAIGVILALFASGYVAMTRHITNSGAFYAFITRGLGRPAGVAAALVALLSYCFLQVALYGALGPAAGAEAAAHLGVHAAWWAWALVAWGLVTLLGQLRVDITGKVLGVLLTAEVIAAVAESAAGLGRPAAGHLSFAALSPAGLAAAGPGAFGVLAVVAILGFVGFEQAPVLAEEARNTMRTIPRATYAAIAMITMLYAGASWAMAVHAGTGHVVAAATSEGPGLLFSLAGAGALPQAAQLLFVTSLFAAALAFHNVVWRYMYALGREHVLPAGLGRTAASGVPRTASLTQSAIGLAVIILYAAAGWNPMTDLFFWLGTTGGFGVLVLLAATSAAVIAFFRTDHRGEGTWSRLAAPALALLTLGAIVVLAVTHYAALLGTPPGDPATWALPASYAVMAAAGAGWAAVLLARRPQVYDAIGLGAPAAEAAAAGKAGA
jgi:amino acid transporter